MIRQTLLPILALAACSPGESVQSESRTSKLEESQFEISRIEIEKSLSVETKVSLKDYRREVEEEVCLVAKVFGKFPDEGANIESLAGPWEARIPEILDDLKRHYPRVKESDLQKKVESYLSLIAQEVFNDLKAKKCAKSITSTPPSPTNPA